VTPDNVTLTIIALTLGIDSIREVDEVTNRRKNSKACYTFHGRDVYAYTAARLASHKINYEQVGKISTAPVISLPFQKAAIVGNQLKGTIDILDIQYGNVWTNIDQENWKKFTALAHNKNEILLLIFKGKKLVYTGAMPFENTFGGVAVGKPLAYLNSLMNLSFALNQGSFSEKYHVYAGSDWTVAVQWVK